MTKPIEEMTPEELKEYENSLNKELKIRELKEKQAKLEEAVKAEETKQKEEEMSALKDEWKNEFYEEHPEYKPKPKINDAGQTKDESKSPMLTYYNNYYERNKKIETESGFAVDLDKDLSKTQFQLTNTGKPGVGTFDKIFENTNSDSGCDDVVSAWSPADTYSKIVWNTMVCKADLFKLCVPGIAINPGDGLSVQIRTYGAFGDPSELGACECASCASISFSTYSLTLKQYNLEGIICGKDIWDVGNVLMDSYLDSMSDSWARWFDEQIYSELETASPGFTQTLANAISCTPSISGDCCTDTSLVDLYNAVRIAKADMHEGTTDDPAHVYKPDYLIVSPTVAAIFGRMQEPTVMPWVNDVKFDENGNLSKINGLKVVEYCGANSCTDTSSEVVAIMIDSRRAVGAVFGQRPKMYKFFQTNCNSYRIDWWAYFAVGELDTDAICHIVNP